MTEYPTTKLPHHDLLADLIEQAAVHRRERDLDRYLSDVGRAESIGIGLVLATELEACLAAEQGK